MNQQGEEADVLAVLTGEGRTFGISAVMVVSYQDSPQKAAPEIWGDGISSDYVARYRERRYDLNSPALVTLNAARLPVIWRLGDFDFRKDSLTVEIEAGARAEGLDKGVLVPIWREDVLRGWVAIALEEASLERVDLFDMQLLGLTAYYRIEELSMKEAAMEESPVSGREREVLELAAEGMSSKQIARALEISSRTVEFHFRNIAEKLRTNNKTHSVAKALRLGVIRPDQASAGGSR